MLGVNHNFKRIDTIPRDIKEFLSYNILCKLFKALNHGHNQSKEVVHFEVLIHVYAYDILGLYI